MGENIKITFKPSEEKGFTYSKNNGKTTLSCELSDGKIICYIYYDFRENPLTLISEADINDNIELKFMPSRIELWVNSRLADEDWPAGKRLFSETDLLSGSVKVCVEEFIPEQKTFPSVIGEFENAEGWKPEGNVFVGDCMPYVNDGRYHVLYLKDRRHHKSKWGFGAHQWEHISTSDFKNWQIHPLAVEITDPIEGSICTGSWIKNDCVQYLFYTVRMANGAPAPIKRSVSKDGYHFIKDESFSLVLSDKYKAPDARDPKVVFGKDGFYHMFLTTSLVEENKGCLAHLVSKDLSEWTECAEPIYVHDTSAQPECPDYIEYNGYDYLIYSIGSKAHYLYSKEPFSEWKVPENPIIPCSSVPKGAIWEGKIMFTGFTPISGYAGTMTFKEATNDPNGILTFLSQDR